MPPRVASSRKTLGDFPTPPRLVEQILDALGPIGSRYSRVLEPSCGRGRFIAGLLDRTDPPSEIIGLEIQTEHAAAARELERRSHQTSLHILGHDAFEMNLARDLPWKSDGPLLVVGNPPWVTVAALGAFGVTSGPSRSNTRKLRGIEAMTGESNFDLSEALWLKLIHELAAERPTIALLCKTAVARPVLRATGLQSLPVTRAQIRQIDARHWFKAAVDACLLVLELGPGPRAVEADLFPDLLSEKPMRTLGFAGGRLIADVEAHGRTSFAEGSCPLVWRQGVKHDAAAIMELTPDHGMLRNKLGELVDVEPEYVYPLWKATDLSRRDRRVPRKFVIVTQRRLNDDPRALESAAPRLWAYLHRHASVFAARRSSIYRNRPPFSLFGIGDYSFAASKVAVSGLHKAPVFRVLGPIEDRPPLVDDTCYFVPCPSLEAAEALAETLNGPVCLDLIRAFCFPDAKRPITKSLLKRIDLNALSPGLASAVDWVVAS
jgi:hypothetical protein